VEASFERQLLGAVHRLTHIDDPERVDFYRGVLSRPEPPALAALDQRRRRLMTMLAWDIGSGVAPHVSLDAYHRALWRENAVRQELLDLLEWLDTRSRTRGRPSALSPEIPLVVHAKYTRNDVLAALGVADGVKPPPSREGLVSTPDGRLSRTAWNFRWRSGCDRYAAMRVSASSV
jgi:hypothetical protein